MRNRKSRILVGDFETTVYKGQTSTEVWASACVEIGTEDVKIFHSIGETFDYFISLEDNLIVYYHNLKFDGAFWLDYLINILEFKQAAENGESLSDFKFVKPAEMRNNTFAYSISNMGAWYRVVIKVRGYVIELRDSLKLLPFSVRQIGQSFATKHKKLDMEYTGFRYAGCEITEEEQKYIANDVLVVKEALEFMFAEGHNKLTIASCALAEFKKPMSWGEIKDTFPNMYEVELDPEVYGVENAGEYIRRSYHGGWCYVVRGKERKIFHNGVTADVNSLYPSMMHSESGNRYPFGLPHFWKGNFIPPDAFLHNHYFFVRFRTRFYIKADRLPFVQVKNNLWYKSTEMLETSDVWSIKYQQYFTEYRDVHGDIQQAILTLTMTCVDFKLFQEQYDLVDFEILDGCWFETCSGLFDDYIDHYKKIKQESKGAKRSLAKLMLNSLYGKMAANTDSSFKVAYKNEETGALSFYTVSANDKRPGYIPIGSAITSYARNFTIRAAQANYYGVDKPGFIYADTDSIHCDLMPEQMKGIKVHPLDFCCWKLEGSWDTGWFVRQKTYIEHVIAEDLEPCEPYYNVKCAGMPEHCKDLFIRSMQEDIPSGEDAQKYTPDEIAFMRQKRSITDFDLGLLVPGKLLPKRIPGGILLTETTYQMR